MVSYDITMYTRSDDVCLAKNIFSVTPLIIT